MRHLRLVLSLFGVGFLAGCTSSRILISLEKYHFPLNHNKIMVVGVIRSSNDSLRSHIEKSISADLLNLGYNAVSARDQFGIKGLSNLSQEETYLKLCDQGIDAVIVVTLIDKNKEKQFQTNRSYSYPDNYYYERIWNYKNIQADLASIEPANNQYFWEAILFNLTTLEAECTIQSPVFSLTNNGNSVPFEKLLIAKMVKESVLQRQTKSTLRPF